MKAKKLLYLLMMFSILSISYSAEVEIKSKSDNSIDFIIKGDTKTRNIIVMSASDKKDKTPDFAKTLKIEKSIDFKSGQKLSENSIIIFDGANSDNISVKGLQPNTKYYLTIFEKDGKNPKTITTFTIASEPKKQSAGIAFKSVTESQIGLLFKKGDGENRIIVASKQEIKDFPVDGKGYKSGKFGDESCKLGSGFVVFNSANDKANGMEVIVKNLQYGKYYFQIFDYNGKDESANYITKKEKSNPRFKYTNLPTPVALEATSISSEGFMANWKPIEEVKYFEFDLSKDENFSSFVDMYNAADVGNSNGFEFAGLEKGTYYYRVKAVNDVSKSKYSNTIKVVIK